MSFSKPCYPEDRAARYELILAQAVSLLDETLNPIANLANMATLCRGSTGASFICWTAAC